MARTVIVSLPCRPRDASLFFSDDAIQHRLVEPPRSLSGYPSPTPMATTRSEATAGGSVDLHADVMIRATRVFPASRWSQVATDVVVLDYDNRHRRRIKMQGEGGLIFLLDLPEAAALADGDGLLLEDGRIVA